LEGAIRAPRTRRALPVCLTLLAALALSAAARADTVTDWNQVAAAALQSGGTATPPGAGQGAPSSVHLAMVHGAVYDAVNAIAGGHAPFVSAPPAQPWYSQQAAVAAAARSVLLNGGLNGADGFAPARVALIEDAYQATLASIPDGPAKAGGVATGEAAAGAMIAARAGDGRFGTFRFEQKAGPGAWRLVPPALVTDTGAWLKDVRPFVLHDPDLFRVRAPHPLSSRAYAANFDEVKAIGAADSASRTPEQTFAARFWGTGNATATMASVLRSVADAQGGTLADHARVFAQAYASAADAAIVTWRGKARYSFWRPATAIHQADSDGNDATTADLSWTSLIPAPPYPDHPSGLSGLGCSVAAALQHHYGRDAATFSGMNSGNVTRTFSSFSGLCDDIVEARIWSGIHFRFADEEAAKLGRRVAHWDLRHALR
jgi:hypothetical protein